MDTKLISEQIVVAQLYSGVNLFLKDTHKVLRVISTGIKRFVEMCVTIPLYEYR